MEGIIDKENERPQVLCPAGQHGEKVERLARDNRPPFNGGTVPDRQGFPDVEDQPQVQDYRDWRRIPYPSLAGRSCHRQSDIEKLLEENYHAATR